MKLSNFDYNLPKEFIAQYPVNKRDEARLMALNRAQRSIEHRKFKNIVDYFKPGDVLVLNKSKVIPARLYGRRKTGAKVEVFLLNVPDKDEAEVLTKCNSKLKEGENIIFIKDKLEGILTNTDKKVRRIKFNTKDSNLMKLVKESGELPLPPYIRRKPQKEDYNTYQTVYATRDGSVASPTAGLHFTRELIDKIKQKGVKVAEVVLHVSYATFSPVKEEKVNKHKMYSEYYEVSKKTTAQIIETRNSRGRIIAVGTTSCRVLETIAGLKQNHKNEPESCSLQLEAYNGWTNLFIYPPYKFKLTDGLITNFHLPKSTLLMLVSAFAGRNFIMEAYREALKRRYRFYSYGDGMSII